MTSIVVKYYEDIKGKYDIDKSHLASINTNGIWVREKSKDNINILDIEDKYTSNFGKQWKEYNSVQIDSINNFQSIRLY